MTQPSYIYSSLEFRRLLANPMLVEEQSTIAGVNYLLVDLNRDGVEEWQDVDPAILPTCPIIGIDAKSDGYGSVADVLVADEHELALIIRSIQASPEAATTLVQLLRHNQSVSIRDGLLAESLAYSTLQQSAGFLYWLATTKKPQAEALADDDVLRVVRQESELHLTLNRPAVHNAFNIALRDALCEALYLAHTDRTIDRVVLRGNGASFCAGGDLSEFGEVVDANAAHLSRTTRSAGALIASLPCPMVVQLHGACIGAGIELPSFASRVIARGDAFFQLPEVAMGLVPGAGGTVSILRRIGRQRTAFMALSNQRIPADVALDWGLIDRLLD